MKAVLHYREATGASLKGRFNVYLHDGDLLGLPTKNAKDMFEMMTYAEAYNALGYNAWKLALTCLAEQTCTQKKIYT